MSEKKPVLPVDQLMAVNLLLVECLKDLIVSKKAGSIPDIEQITKTITLSEELTRQAQNDLTGSDSEITLSCEKANFLLNEALKAISNTKNNGTAPDLSKITHYLAMADAVIQNVLKELEDKNSLISKSGEEKIKNFQN
jgi:hypothetical protein